MTVSTDAGKTGLFDPSNVAITGGSIANRPLRTLAARGVVPQVATAAVAGSPTVTDLVTSTSSIAGAVRIAADDPVFTYTGCQLGPWVGNAGFITPVNDLNDFISVTFCTDAPVFELSFVRSFSKIYYEVDGQPALNVQFGEDGAGSEDLHKIDFGGVRKARHIRVSGTQLILGGINVGPNDSVWAAGDQRPLMAVLGDSYVYGTGANAPALTWAATAARLLNYQYWLEGIGGTGFTTAGTQSIPSRNAAKLNQLQRRVGGVNTNIQPDLVVWALGYNDAGASAASVQAGFDVGYSSATTKPSILVGPWTPQGATTNLDSIRTILQAKAAQYGCTYDDIRNYVNSVNKTVLTGGDNVHPLQVGHDFLGFRIAQDLMSAGY